MMMPPKKKIRGMYDLAQQRIRDFHIRSFPDQPGPIFLISTQYPGVWLEHAFDAVCYARLNPGDTKAAEVARNQMLLFLRNQKEDGRLPYNVLDASIMKERVYGAAGIVGYNQLQECVSFARLCMDTYEITGDDAFLAEAYERCAKWDEWQCANRMSLGTGLIELFCLYDTGHDNSARLKDIPNRCPDNEGKVAADADALPILAPDMNAVFYGNRVALSDMARRLGREDEAETWAVRADEVKRKIMDLLYDEQDQFFYDRDRNGNLRKHLSISITNVFTEHVPDQALFDAIYAKHIKNPEEFWTPYPLPSMAISDPGSRYEVKGNSWGFFSQALTALRCMRWMDFYGKSADYDHMLTNWVAAMASQEGKRFTQELHPITGQPSECSEWYSSAMLLYIYAVRRLKLI